MRSIAIINQKGGVGKTTTAVNLSAALAASGQRICLMDLDPQAHASLHLGLTLGEDDGSMYDVLVGDTPLAAILRKVNDRLSILPSHIDLAAAEMELAGEVGREVILRDRLEPFLASQDRNSVTAEQFDFLLIDCPPSLGVLTLNALTAVDEVFLPLQPHFLALHGLSKLLRTIEIVSRRLNPTLRLAGVLLCMYESGTRLAAEVSRDVEAFFKEQSRDNPIWGRAQSFRTRIRRNIRLAESPSFGQSILEYAPTSHGAEDYLALAKEILAQEFLTQENLTDEVLDVTDSIPAPPTAPTAPRARTIATRDEHVLID